MTMVIKNKCLILALFITLIISFSLTSLAATFDGDVDGIELYLYGGSITDTGNLFLYDSDGNCYYTGSSNPSRSWVKSGSRYWFVSNASRTEYNGKSVWICDYPQDEWCLIQTPGANEYLVYYFEPSGWLSSDTTNGYKENGQVLKYNRARKLKGGVAESDIRIPIYDDYDKWNLVNGHWYYIVRAVNTGTWGQQFSVLKEGYAIIIDEDGNTYSLFKFDNYNYTYVVAGLELEALLRKVTSDMNKHPAKTGELELPIDDWDADEFDEIDDWEDPDMVTPEQTSGSYTTYSNMNEVQYVYGGGNYLESQYNLLDSFMLFRWAGGETPNDWVMFNTYWYYDEMANKGRGEAAAAVAGMGGYIGDAPLYGFMPQVRMPNQHNSSWDSSTPTQISLLSPLTLLDAMPEVATGLLAALVGRPETDVTMQLSSHWIMEGAKDATDYMHESSPGVYWSHASEDSPPTTYKCPNPNSHGAKCSWNSKNHDGSDESNDRKDVSYPGPTGLEDCEGEIKFWIDLNPINQVTSEPVNMNVYHLYVEDDENIIAAPEQNGSVEAYVNDQYLNVPDIEDGPSSTVAPWHLWQLGQPEYGIPASKTAEEGVPTTQVGTASLNVLVNSKFFYPYIRRRMRPYPDTGKWYDAYTTAHRRGILHDNILVQIGVNPTNKPTLHVESVWDGWSNTMNGLEKNGVLSANGGDRNVVVDGGSTMYITSKNTKKLDGTTTNHTDTEIGKVGVTVWIDSCYGNEQFYSPEEEGDMLDYDAWEAFVDNTSVGKDFERAAEWLAPGGVSAPWRFSKNDIPLIATRYQEDFYLGDEHPSFKLKSRRASKVPEAVVAIEDFIKDFFDNVSRFRLEKIMAEGLFTQGQEVLFESVAKTVSGVDAVTEFGSQGSGNKTYNTSRREQTAALGNKLNTDTKYQLLNHNEDNTGSENHDDNRIGMEQIGELKYKLFMAELDIHEKDNEAYLILSESDLSAGRAVKNMYKLAMSEYKPNGIVQSNKLLDKLNKEWREMEVQTGWIRELLQSTVHQKGKGTSRSSIAAMQGDVGGRGTSALWYNDAIPPIFLIRGEAQFKLSLDAEKIEVMDPALCGVAENQYDLRNWNAEEDESYMVNGVKIPLKNKVRTFRYQISPKFNYEGEDEEVIPANNKDTNLKGDTYYVGTIQHPLRGTAEDEAIMKEKGAWIYPEHYADLYDEVYLDVYAQTIKYMLKSKLMYLTNATIQDNNQ